MLPLSGAPSEKAAASTVQADRDLDELNEALGVLAAAFPNVRPEVFREMLKILSKESRAQVVAEQLLRDEAKWVRGRWRFPAQETSSKILKEVYELSPSGISASNVKSRASTRQEEADEKELVPQIERFRTQSYKDAVFTALRQEFKTLSRSTINGVLAEQNFSYSLSHPILVGLAAKSWRITFSSIISHFKTGNSSKRSADENHYMLQWTFGSGSDRGVKIARLKPTGDSELDEELRRTVLQPVLNRRVERENAVSLELALLLNEQEAEQSGALFECQVCCADATFEQIVVCTSNNDAHITCFGCIQRAMSEALYGQSWDLTIDHRRGQISCLAPTSEGCDGCIPRALAERAILSGRGGYHVWQQFETKLTEEALRNSGASFVQCPFCEYSEVDHLYLPSEVAWIVNPRTPFYSLFLFLLGSGAITLLALISLVPYLLVMLLGLPLANFRVHLLLITLVKNTFRNASALHTRNSLLSQKFVCKNPSCRRSSCLNCHKQWRDVHRCNESAILSLRTTIEAARTAALKRTCPRCGVGFVKASGCNKMVCVCGYSMCYVCREGLGDKKSGLAIGGDAGNQNVGYRHFCQHFRPLGGQCTECDSCDLYKAEDDDEIVKRAGERAEREWRDRNEVGDVARISLNNEETWFDVLHRSTKQLTVQGVVNWWVANVFACRLE